MTAVDSADVLLGLLGTGPSHGYDLKHGYDRLFGGGRLLAFGQVYATLARLLRHGLVELLGDEAGEGPDRKRYAITAAGRDRVTQWLFRPDVPSPVLQSNLFAKTVVALLLGDDADRLLDVQRAEHLGRMRALTAQKHGADLATVLACDHALFHIEADLRWIDLTSARLTELRQEVAR
ncbi:MAG: PadR family transcriptional regulator [Micrococcales bacterium]|nr:PadR family transcriptional regulator [Micrococcales bacterium]